MKLYFQPDAALWQPERYHYAAEQMMLTLFPGEKPEYPTQPPHTLEEGPFVRFSLTLAADEGVLEAVVQWADNQVQGRFTFPARELSQSPEGVYHTLQHALKLAFYQAGTALLGHQPPWGALTGVRPVKLPTRAMGTGASPEEAQAQLEQGSIMSPRPAQSLRWTVPGQAWQPLLLLKKIRCPSTSASPFAPPGVPTAPSSPPMWAGL